MWEQMPVSRGDQTVQGLAGKRRQRGQTLLEFALVALLFFVVLFCLIEFARALWTWNTIVQATRAGARFAVVEAPVASDTTVKNYVVYLNGAGTGSPVLPGLTSSHVQVSYLKHNPPNPPITASTVSEKYDADVVQISISGYSFTFIVPFFDSSITIPSFTTTLPIEGLGAS
jgi:Flp pilus assembly protein TadG